MSHHIHESDVLTVCDKCGKTISTRLRQSHETPGTVLTSYDVCKGCITPKPFPKHQAVAYWLRLLEEVLRNCEITGEKWADDTIQSVRVTIRPVEYQFNVPADQVQVVQQAHHDLCRHLYIFRLIAEKVELTL